MRLLRYIILFGFLISVNITNAQNDSIKGKIYSDFINQSVLVHDTTFKKKSELIIISDIKNYDLGYNLDIESLHDYLTGNTETNELFQLMKEKFGQSPISNFYQVPWGDFGLLLTRDSTFGYMILELDTLLQKKYRFTRTDNILTDYKLKFTNGKIPHGSNSWDRFYKKNKNCYGILKLSDILISNDYKYALFYTENYRYSLFASGDLVFMERTTNGWMIIQYIEIWIS